MGIPSYYRTLIQRMPHAIQRKAPASVKTLVVDMNCMIYHVLKEPKMESIPYPGEIGRLGWEKKLQEEVCSYLTHIWKEAGAPGQTYIALDGVVPYAKIKQQRFRRFKGGAAAISEATPAIGDPGVSGLPSSGFSPMSGAWGSSPTWDKNAITPGTHFMETMGNSLREVGKKYGWIISDTSEPGEGEHKVLQWLLRKSADGLAATPKEGAVIVYGLDADLILLCLIAGDKLGPQYPIFLLREAMAFGKLVRLNESNEVDLCFFQISTLRDSLQRPPNAQWSKEQFYDYVFGMSFCGNDFLPTGLSLRIRDDGHSILLAGLADLWSKKKNLVTIDIGVIRPNADGLKSFAQWISKQEERLIVTTIKRKMTARLGDDEADNLPLREQAEKPMIEHRVSDGLVYLKKGWHSEYCKLAIGEDTVEQRKARVADFWRGWCWILDYYQGRRVDLEWVYPAGYPPTWADLVKYFELPTDDWVIREPLKPQEQLALVLPMSSWGLMVKTPFRNLPVKIPQFWPQGFALETFAKRFGWECEPMIPMLTPGRLRYETMGRKQEELS